MAGRRRGIGTSAAQGLLRFGSVRVRSDAAGELPRLLAPADADDKDLTATVRRADASGPERLIVRAVGDDARLLARQEVGLAPGVDRSVAHLAMPSELRNRAASIQVEGESSAGAVLLLDERWRRRPVGIVGGQRDIAVLSLPDVPPAGTEEKAAIVKWLENGGVILRFAGPHLAEQAEDDMLPVTLRRGGRTLGGALSWEKPAKLAPFAA